MRKETGDAWPVGGGSEDGGRRGGREGSRRSSRSLVISSLIPRESACEEAVALSLLDRRRKTKRGRERLTQDATAAQERR